MHSIIKMYIYIDYFFQHLILVHNLYLHHFTFYFYVLCTTCLVWSGLVWSGLSAVCLSVCLIVGMVTENPAQYIVQCSNVPASFMRVVENMSKVDTACVYNNRPLFA